MCRWDKRSGWNVLKKSGENSVKADGEWIILILLFSFLSLKVVFIFTLYNKDISFEKSLHCTSNESSLWFLPSLLAFCLPCSSDVSSLNISLIAFACLKAVIVIITVIMSKACDRLAEPCTHYFIKSLPLQLARNHCFCPHLTNVYREASCFIQTGSFNSFNSIN